MFEIFIGVLIVATFLAIGVSGYGKYLLYALVFSFSIEPRLAIGSLQAYQRADMRFSDLLIFSMFVSCWARIFLGKYRPHLYFHNVFLGLFIFSAFMSALLSWSVYNYNLIHSMFFFIRLWEYSSLVYIIPNYINDQKIIFQCFKLYVLSFSINAIWLFYQMISVKKGPAISFADVSHYGYTLFGITQPLAVGGVWLFSFLLFIICYLYKKNNKIYLILSFVSIVGVLTSLSRTSIGTVVFNIPIFFIMILFGDVENKFGKIILSVLLLFMLCMFTYLLVHSDIGRSLPLFRMDYENSIKAITEVRLTKIWLPILKEITKSPVFGFGAGNISRVVSNFDEGHNYFLRLLVETGILGFSCFTMFLLGLMRNVSAKMIRGEYIDDRNAYILNSFALLWLLSIVFMSLFQDALWTTELAIPTFIIIGMMNWLMSRDNNNDNRRGQYVEFRYQGIIIK